MTDVCTASTMTSEDRDNKLLQLAIYLNGLPDSLPIKDPADSHYNFQIFELEAEWIDTIGSFEGAVNRELECRLGPWANGPIEFTERGLPVEALAMVLNDYTNQFPDDILLAKWVDDALLGVKHTFHKLKTLVCVVFLHCISYIKLVVTGSSQTGTSLPKKA